MVALRDAIVDEIERAATHAFSASFLISAAFALAALMPIGSRTASGRSSCEAERERAPPLRRLL